MLNEGYEKEPKALFEISILRKTGGLLPGDYIRKVVIPSLDKRGLITHDAPKKLRHWKTIVGADEPFVIEFLMKWYKSESHPHYWATWYQKQTPGDRQLWEEILNGCLASGWCWPSVVNGALTFGSRYKPEERPSAPDDMGRISHAAGWYDEYDDFVHED